MAVELEWGHNRKCQIGQQEAGVGVVVALLGVGVGLGVGHELEAEWGMGHKLVAELGQHLISGS